MIHSESIAPDKVLEWSDDDTDVAPPYECVFGDEDCTQNYPCERCLLDLNDAFDFECELHKEDET